MLRIHSSKGFALAFMVSFIFTGVSIAHAESNVAPPVGLFGPLSHYIATLTMDIRDLESTIAAFADSFTTKQLYFNRATGQQLCLRESNGATICVDGDQLAGILAATSLSSPSSSLTTPATDTPPVIAINGDNPATIQVGASYTDLGATITGPQTDINLAIETYLNGVLENPIELDTSAAATDTIDYVATDGQGLTSTSTRSVIVEATIALPAASSATSTSQ